MVSARGCSGDETIRRSTQASQMFENLTGRKATEEEIEGLDGGDLALGVARGGSQPDAMPAPGRDRRPR